MAKILCISSQVVSGHVGNSAMTFPLQRLGYEVLAIPTVLLSNHPGHGRFAGAPLAPGLLEDILGMLESEGRLSDIAAVITGYLPGERHAALASDAIARVKQSSPEALVMVDPVIGDSPRGLYINNAVAKYIRDRLITVADIITPNFFEFQWLLNTEIADIRKIPELASALHPSTVLITSAPAANPARLQNLLITQTGNWSCEVERLNGAPNGTGDLIAALFLGWLLKSRNSVSALSAATAGVNAVLEMSLGDPELELIETQNLWIEPELWKTNQIMK